MNYRNIIDKALDSICVLSDQNTVLYSNPAFCELTGYTESELIGSDFSKLLPKDIAPRHRDLITQYINSGRQESTVLGKIRRLQLIHKSGEIIPIELKAFEIDSISSPNRIFAGIIRDLRERDFSTIAYNRLLFDLEKLGFIDSTTQLPNEKYLFARFDELIENSKIYKESIIGILDLDEFDEIIQTYGEEEANQVLKSVGREIQQGLRVKDYIGILDTGELLTLFPGTPLADVILLLDNLRTQIHKRSGFIPSHPNLHISISVGCSRISHSPKPREEILIEANLALRKAKTEGKNKLFVFGFY